MKASIGFLATLIAASIWCAQATEADKQPVVAYKTVETGKPWTIGIYDATGPYSNNDKLVSEKIVFKKDTNFVSGKGKKLYFNFKSHPRVIVYVYKKMDGGEGKSGPDLAQAFTGGKTDKGFFLTSDPITQNDALPGSKIKITADTVTIEPPKDTTRSIVIYTLDEAQSGMPFTIQAAKIDNALATGDNLYGKPVTIKKHTPGKTYKLTIPQGKDFYIIRKPIQGSPSTLQPSSVLIPQKNIIKKDSELAIGYNISAKSKVNRQSMIENTAMITIPLKKECRTSAAICRHIWSVQIHDANKQYIGSQASLGSEAETIQVPANKPFWVYVSQTGGVGSLAQTKIQRSSPITKNDVMIIDEKGNADIKNQTATLSTINAPIQKKQQAGEQVFGDV